MKNSFKTLLITGSQGFTSHYLRESFLKEGYTVWGLTRHNPRPWEIAADLTDTKTLRKAIAKIAPNYIIHLAGISSVMHENNEELYRVNCLGTLNLLSALQEEKIPVQKIILASSAYVYGHDTSEHSLISEKACPKPISHYAMSKLSMEYMALSLYQELPIIIARPFNYTGLGQKKHVLVPKILHHFALKSSQISLGNIDIYREFNDVRMVVAAYQGLLHHAQPGMTVNICTGKSHSLKEVLALCSTITHHQLDINVDPKLVRNNDVMYLSGDPSLLHSIIPNLPSYSLEDTLRWMYTLHN